MRSTRCSLRDLRMRRCLLKHRDKKKISMWNQLTNHTTKINNSRRLIILQILPQMFQLIFIQIFIKELCVFNN